MNWEELTPAERLVAEQMIMNLRTLNMTYWTTADGQVLRLAEASAGLGDGAGTRTDPQNARGLP